MVNTKPSPPYVTLTSIHGSLSVSPQGGGLVQWQPQGFANPVFYHDPVDGARLSMGEILSPFPNRLRDGKFPDGDAVGKLKKVTRRGPHSIHAFVRQLIWAVEINPGGDGITSRCQWREGEMRPLGYPFGLAYEIKYTLGHDALTVVSSVKNTGSRGAPFALAFHPYFALSGGVDGALLHLPAKTLRSFSPPPARIKCPRITRRPGRGF